MNNPVSSKLSKEQITKFYGSLIPKMKKLLSTPNKEIKPRKKKVKTPETSTNNLAEQSSNVIPIEQSINDKLIKKTPETGEITKPQDTKIKSEDLNVELMSKDECLKY